MIIKKKYVIKIWNWVKNTVFLVLKQIDSIQKQLNKVDYNQNIIKIKLKLETLNNFFGNKFRCLNKLSQKRSCTS